MNYIFIASKENSHGRIILNMLLENGFFPRLVLLGSKRSILIYRLKSIIRYYNRHGIVNTIWRLFIRTYEHRDVNICSTKNDRFNYSIEQLCKKNNIIIKYYNNINDHKIISLIKEILPQYIILGGAPLINKKILKIPKIGVLNAHPGLLPEARGMDVVENSILNNIPFGVTLFKVDKGIDTGPIYKRIKFLEHNKLNIEQIRHELEKLCGRSVVELLTISNIKEIKFKNQENSNSNLFHSLSRHDYNKAKNILADLNRQ